MEQHFTNYLPNKSQIPGKREGILLLEIEEKESKKLKTFSQLLEQIRESSVQSEQSKTARAAEEMFHQETDQELGISGNTGIIPK